MFLTFTGHEASEKLQACPNPGACRWGGGCGTPSAGEPVHPRVSGRWHPTRALPRGAAQGAPGGGFVTPPWGSGSAPGPAEPPPRRGEAPRRAPGALRGRAAGGGPPRGTLMDELICASFRLQLNIPSSRRQHYQVVGGCFQTLVLNSSGSALI